MIHFIHNIMFFFFFCKFLIRAHFNIGYRGLDTTKVCTHPQTHSHATSINPVCPSACFRKSLSFITTHFLLIKTGPNGKWHIRDERSKVQLQENPRARCKSDGQGCRVWTAGLGCISVKNTCAGGDHEGWDLVGIGRAEGVSDKWPMFGVCVRVKWGGTSAAERCRAVFFPWSTAPAPQHTHIYTHSHRPVRPGPAQLQTPGPMCSQWTDTDGEF